MNIDSRLYRRTAPRTVGTPVPPNVADVAAGLDSVILWSGDCGYYEPLGLDVDVFADGRWHLANSSGKDRIDIKGATGGKRAAVLALATHLVAQRSGVMFIDREANPPTAPIESVPVFKVPSPAWAPKVGDRVRFIGDTEEGDVTDVNASLRTTRVVFAKNDADYMWFIWEKLEPIPAEKQGLPSFESLVWPLVCGAHECHMPDGLYMRVSGPAWNLFSEFHRRLDGGVTFDQKGSRHVAYDAWVALQK